MTELCFDILAVKSFDSEFSSLQRVELWFLMPGRTRYLVNMPFVPTRTLNITFFMYTCSMCRDYEFRPTRHSAYSLVNLTLSGCSNSFAKTYHCLPPEV